jgi:ATP-dependent Clp protease, protease subunit
MTAPGWFNITASDAGTTRGALYNEIGVGGVTAEDFLDRISKISGPILLEVCSIGGDFFQGMTIADALRRRGGVTAHVVQAASIASAIAAAGERVSIAQDGYFMTHAPFATMTGTAEDMDYGRHVA